VKFKGEGMKNKLAIILLTAVLLNASHAAAAKAIFAGGCFWCMEADYEKLEGVTDVISGFTGGAMKNPTYYGNHQGHHMRHGVRSCFVQNVERNGVRLKN